MNPIKKALHKEIGKNKDVKVMGSGMKSVKGNKENHVHKLFSKGRTDLDRRIGKVISK